MWSLEYSYQTHQLLIFIFFRALLLQILNVTVKFKTAWKACSLVSYCSVVIHWFRDFLLLGSVEPAMCSNASLRCLIKVMRSHRWVSSFAVNCFCSSSCSDTKWSQNNAEPKEKCCWFYLFITHKGGWWTKWEPRVPSTFKSKSLPMCLFCVVQVNMQCNFKCWYIM